MRPGRCVHMAGCLLLRHRRVGGYWLRIQPNNRSRIINFRDLIIHRKRLPVIALIEH